MKKCAAVCAIALVLTAGGVANADWTTFVIRGANSGGTQPVIAEDPTGYTGWTAFGVFLGGQKAGWGTSDMDGQTVGDIQSLSIVRDSSVTGWGPYFNIWITDGLGGYACLSNEPSHTTEYSDYGETAYDMTWDGALKNATTWVYEVDSIQGFLLPNGVTTTSNIPAGTITPKFCFDDFADYTIATPPTHWGGSGAPDDLNAGTYTAYGFNWIFGDTQDNYVTGGLGYLVKDPTLVSGGNVPEPASFAIWALLASVGLVGCRRRAK